MFTGLVEEIGTVLSLQINKGGAQLEIGAPTMAAQVRQGDSVAVNGCCLTATAPHSERVTFDLLEETLVRTNLRTLRIGSRINLERALAADGRLGGHFVQGHIDRALRVLSFEAVSSDYRMEMELPNEFAQYVAEKGSIALNGISLTVAEVLPKSFVVWIIPHTKRHTNLQEIAAGDLLNAEFDLLAKYVEKMLNRHGVRD